MKIPKGLANPPAWAVITAFVTLFLIFKEVTPWKINVFLLIMFMIYLLIVSYSQFYLKD